MSKVRSGGERCFWKHFSYGLIKYNTYVAQTFGQRDKCVGVCRVSDGISISVVPLSL